MLMTYMQISTYLWSIVSASRYIGGALLFILSLWQTEQTVRLKRQASLLQVIRIG